jgi:hypothetical protein
MNFVSIKLKYCYHTLIAQLPQGCGKMVNNNFRGVSLRTELICEVESVIKETGKYGSIAEFISEAVRLRLAEVQKIAKEAQ